jgi:hypothetical protein
LVGWPTTTTTATVTTTITMDAVMTTITTAAVATGIEIKHVWRCGILAHRRFFLPSAARPAAYRADTFCVERIV